MGFWFFWTVVASASAFVVSVGGREEKLVLGILVGAYVATMILYRLGSADWLQPQIGIMISDSISAILLLVIALRSRRFWPLPIVAFQILPIATQFVTAFGQNLVSYALGVTQGAWSYLQMLILILASLRTRRRLQNAKKTGNSLPT